ncbi:MAG: PilT/PilU family type 4a pilus ATPase [Gammaproteobacteria bacterium]|jgi:twitching motility protein PilU|nr:PilT/PilU family type 4a pilus ATPase [Gammaproteobacteria bacterium]
MELRKYLIKMKEMNASDLFLTTGLPATVKCYGKLSRLDDVPLDKTQIKKLAYETMNPEQQAQFEKQFEMNLAVADPELGRFRVSIFVQRTDVAVVIRRIQMEIPTLKSLELPSILSNIIMEPRGLVLVVGATGSGKSTTLAALIDYRNENSDSHIITIEDPIEFVHQHKQCIINQREVGMDTISYEVALKNTLRQAPDVILIGEIRSRETMEHAIAFAETGHLCLSTLHANNANQAFDRIINFFPEDRRRQLLLDLSFNIKAIISQRLVKTIDGKRTAAIEILLGTPHILSLIHRGEIDEIKEAMEKSDTQGMQTFDQALERLYFEKKITLEEALSHADSRNNLRLKIQLNDKSVPSEEKDEPASPGISPLSTVPEDKDLPDKGGLSLLDDK